MNESVARRILEPILFCQAIEIKDPTSLFFEDVPLSFSAYNAPLEVPSHPSNRSGYLQMCRYSVDPCIVELGTSSVTAPWMPGTQLYTPGIHRADLKNNPFQPYP